MACFKTLLNNNPVMKNQITTLTIVLFIMAGLGGCKQSGTHNGLITIDVKASYPVKELILQDFMDVEYIPLETNDEFITQGVIMAISNKYILAKNGSNDGDIFFFDRKTGNALRKINKMGKGPEEYMHITDIVLDEENNEIFINCISTRKVCVYDLFGNFKRSFNHKEDTRYVDVFNFNTDNLIVYNESYYKIGEKRGSEVNHLIVSKQDGSITRNISIPFDVYKAPLLNEGEATVVTSVRPIIPNHGSWLLVETSSDTVYNYLPEENKLTPFLVKSPTTNPEIILTMGTLTDRYYFMTTKKLEFDFTTGRGFPIADLMYDKQENAMFNPIVINGDFVERKRVDMTSHPVNNDIAAFQNIEAYQLVDAYKNEGLKGKLKEIAAELDEGSNPVIMVMKYKK
jgi:hypothetical protein